MAERGVIRVLIRNARVWPSAEAVADVRIADGRVVDRGPGLRAFGGEDELDAAGCALLPGLHDHHVHLRALAAAQASVQVGPEQVGSAAELAARLREADAAAPAGAWLRCVGYHEAVAGPLDRWVLDRLMASPARPANPARPVRVQHRTGALWVLNSAAVDLLGLDGDGPARDLTGVERDGGHRATGRLWRMDRWLGDRVPGRPGDLAAGLASVSARAAAVGVTGFTDATPDATGIGVAGLAAAVADGTIAQRLHCMAPADHSAVSVASGRFSIGPVKIMLDDETLPSLDALADSMRRAHAARRPVAVHCVTRVQLVLTLAALDAAGRAPGDRIEHGAVIPAELVPALRGLTVVSQPHFVVERGEQYARDVAPGDLPDLWRLRSLIDAGVAVAAGTDAPFGGADPWPVMRAATRRPAALGPGETVDPATAARLFLGSAAAPSVPRAIAPGAAADLVLLRCPPREAVRSLGADLVAATIIDGDVVYRAGSG